MNDEQTFENIVAQMAKMAILLQLNSLKAVGDGEVVLRVAGQPDLEIPVETLEDVLYLTMSIAVLARRSM